MKVTKIGLPTLCGYFLAPATGYFGEQDGKIIVLLCGGDKDSQSKDIELAQTNWKEYVKP